MRLELFSEFLKMQGWCPCFPALSEWQTGGKEVTPELLCQFLQKEDNPVWLDGSSNPAGRWSWVAWAPRTTIHGTLSSHEDWQRMRDASQKGWWLGWIDFQGDFCFKQFDQLWAWHASSRTWWKETADREISLLSRSRRSLKTSSIELREDFSETSFLNGIRLAKEYIASGDIYQVNLSRQFSGTVPEEWDSLAAFLKLKHISPAPCAAWFDWEERTILSSSPESFLEIYGQRIATHPIKGTRPRGKTAADDLAQIEALLLSAKENAELLMITDLLRNDLGVLCDFGSVKVTSLARVESFAFVHHLISTVEGQLREGNCPWDAVSSCFPGGSISGAPKKRALEIIHEIEPFDRKLFTGTFGILGPQFAQMDIAIRTLNIENQHALFHAGAGIVADSEPEMELREVAQKAAGMVKTLSSLQAFHV